MLTLDKIYHASYVLKDVIRPTHLVKAQAITDECDIYLKPENLQITGSFKVRGSGYKISQLSDEEKKKIIEETLKDKEKLDTLIRKGFNKCDSNNSGFIEIDELWDVIGDLYDDLGMTHLTKEKVDKVMKDYDFNKDGKLSFEETKKFIIEFTKKAIESGVLDE